VTKGNMEVSWPCQTVTFSWSRGKFSNGLFTTRTPHT